MASQAEVSASKSEDAAAAEETKAKVSDDADAVEGGKAGGDENEAENEEEEEKKEQWGKTSRKPSAESLQKAPRRRRRDDGKMKPDEAARKIQGFFHHIRARRMLLMLLDSAFEKVFDEDTGAFFYFNKKTGQSQWTKPALLKDDEDVALTPRSRATYTGLTNRTGSMSAATGEIPADVGDALESERSIASILSLDGFLARHGLIQYKEMLSEDGFEDMESMLGIEEVDMDAIGMRTGHKRKLQRALRELDRSPRSAMVLDQVSDMGSVASSQPTTARSGAGAGAGAGVGGKHRGSIADRLKLDLSKGKKNRRRSSNFSKTSTASGQSEHSARMNIRAGRLPKSRNSGVSGVSMLAGEEEKKELEIQLTSLFEGDDMTFPVEGQIVRVHYKGYFADGTMFESSRARGSAFQFKLGVGQVIEGWDIAIPQMSKGQRAKFSVPPELAYGVEGRPPVIAPNSTLTFEVELIDCFEPDVELTPREYYDDDEEHDGMPDDEALKK